MPRRLKPLGPDAKDRKRGKLIRAKEAAKKRAKAAEDALDAAKRATAGLQHYSGKPAELKAFMRRGKAAARKENTARIKFQRAYSKFAQAASALDAYERRHF